MRRFFILEKIAEKEKIFATEEDIQTRVSEIANVYNKRPEEILHELTQSGRFDEMRVEICHSKVRKFLREKAKISRQNGTSENVPKKEGSEGGQ